MKKILSILLVLSLCLGLGACASAGRTTADGSENFADAADDADYSASDDGSENSADAVYSASAAGSVHFDDVPDDSYYAAPVRWALEKGIVTGTGSSTFSPEAECTMAEIITFLWRAMGRPTPKISNPFNDVKSGAYYYQAALWASEKGLVSGNTFGPDDPCTRGQTVTCLWICAGRPSAKQVEFSDVSPDADYAAAVSWAVEKGIAAGTSAKTFSPDDACTRGQIVTFLYRDIGAASAEPVSADVSKLLSGVPYYGDVSKCKMTAQQAAAYAQVIADGIAGKYDMYDLWGYHTDDPEPLFWEISNDVYGYGPYKTNRANVILADLDGSGVPYLYLFSSLVDYSSYSVFGWTGSEAKFAIGDENYMGRGGSALFECDDGTVALSDSGASGAASHGGSTYVFSNGAAKKVFSWDVTVGWDDWDDGILHVTINGKTTDYPPSTDYGEAMSAAISEDPCTIVDMETRNLPYAPFSEVESRPTTLRRMLDALNNYASVMSGGKLKPVAVPEPSSTQLMAQAMLAKLDELTDPDAYWTGGPEAYLLDMNADGTPELVYAESGTDYHVFCWNGKELYEHIFRTEGEYWFCTGIVKYHNEYALCCLSGAGAAQVHLFYFLDRMDELAAGAEFIGYDEDGIPDFGDAVYSYNQKEISYEEYCRLYDEYGPDNTNEVTDGLPSAKTELRKLLAA